MMHHVRLAVGALQKHAVLLVFFRMLGKVYNQQMNRTMRWLRATDAPESYSHRDSLPQIT